MAQIEPLQRIGHDLVETNWVDLLPKIIVFKPAYKVNPVSVDAAI